MARFWQWTIMLTALALSAALVHADDDDAAGDADGLIKITLPEDVEIRMLVEYVAQRTQMNVLFDEQVGRQRVTLKTPREIPASSLPGLLTSVLQMKNLVLIDDQQPGFKRIVQANNLLAIARLQHEGQAPPEEPAAVVSQVFRLAHSDTQRAEQLIRPFLTQPGGNSFALPEQRYLIVTDFAQNMARVRELIELIDQAGPRIDIEFLKIQHLDAGQIAQQVMAMLAAKQRAEGAADRLTTRIELLPDLRTNQLTLVGTAEQLEEAKRIIDSLDGALDLVTKVYQLQTAQPDRIDRLAKELLGPLKASRVYRSAIDRDGAMLIVTATPEAHTIIEGLKRDLDAAYSDQQSPIRFYKLQNTTASEVMQTIQAIEGVDGVSALSLGFGEDVEAVPAGTGRGTARRGDDVPGANRPPAGVGEPLPEPPVYQRSDDDGDARAPAPGTGDGAAGGALFEGGTSGGASGGGGRRSVRTERATITSDPNTNTIIVVAPPAEQRVYEQLIKRLDYRRPQVMVEVTIVTLDTSDGFSLGVEISRVNGGDNQVLTFSSFGLNEVDGDTGRITLSPSLGFNGALISADIADIVIKALKSNGRARVTSTPRILVNDNATGTLSSINEAAFTSVNASDTVATTSFAGYVSAGTDITVTPHISEGDHLQLEFTVDLNSFGEGGTESVPPPRQTNSVSSEVTIPDNHTIIVGGLNRTDFSEAVSRVPLLGEIPGLEYLFSSRTISDSSTTFFVFIRPVILRDDKFRDLKYFSQRDAELAMIPGDYPVSEPIAVP